MVAAARTHFSLAHDDDHLLALVTEVFAVLDIWIYAVLLECARCVCGGRVCVCLDERRVR